MSERVVGGKYALEKEIGRGAMGLVWVAFDQQLHRRVALKLMAPEKVAAASSRIRFEREAMAIARLRNQHVIQIYDYGIDEGSPYIVMELLEGEDLEVRLGRQPRMPFAATLTVIRQAAKALAAAHAAGIVHRDLKPANIFLARGDAEEVVKILDFGVVSMQSEAAPSAPGGLVGTPVYMSPEQMRASTQDHRTDLWSLAVVAYRMLTGKLPFTASSLGDLIVKTCLDPVEPPSRVAPDLPAGADDFFARALAKDPGQRFQSARELAQAFAALGEEGAKGPAKILVVDDEPDVATLIRQRFRRQIRDATYAFVFASDGESALAELRRNPDADVVLTDINMPGMDGLTLLGRVGEVNPIARTIIVSAYGDMGNIRVAMNRGAFDFLVKPIDLTDLEVTIRKTLEHVAAARKGARSSEENSVLQMFVQRTLLERIRLLGLADAMGIEALDATIVFMDVCGFDAGALGRSPEEAVRVLNANFEVLVPEVTSRGGAVERFFGEEIMAAFRGPGHATRALDASVAVRAQLQSMAERAGAGSPYAHGVRMGVATGQAIAAGIGSKAFSRLDYTLIGDVVSAAEHLTRSASAGQILVTSAVREAAGGAFSFEAAGEQRLPGADAPAAVFNMRKAVTAAVPSPAEEAADAAVEDAAVEATHAAEAADAAEAEPGATSGWTTSGARTQSA